MVEYNIFGEVLALPCSAATYEMSRRLADCFPDAAIVEGSHYLFDISAASKAKVCTIEASTRVHNQVTTCFDGEGGLERSPDNAWFHVDWRGHPLQVIILTIEGCEYFWIIASTAFLAERFLAEVCHWNTEVRDEVLVFDDGCWGKDPALRRAIEAATFDNLILRAGLKEELRADVEQFFAARATYERYRIPWKRGVVLIGPPGNGKTHALKALINATGKPCLYVKSFASNCVTEHGTIRRVFHRARRTSPCLLVFEDLDSLVNDKNRAVFLNELDGFAVNTGVLTVATTNHPDKLDPAILDRPSRFDRKFHFELPGNDERRAYLVRWNESLESTIRLGEAEIEAAVEATEGFSFAYLKELFVSAMVAWFEDRDRWRLGEAVAAQAPKLRAEMASAPPPAPAEENQD
jgi:ATPase family associated with various cellular activities (AAA)